MTSEVRVPLKENDCNIEQEDVKMEKKASIIQNDVDDKEKDAPYFRKLLSDTRAQLSEKCGVWDKILLENASDISESIQGDIRTVIGQAHLVMKERGKQFSGLIDNHEYGTSEKQINPSDLQGFWDMIYFQVEDVEQKFTDLHGKKANNWIEIEQPLVVKPKTKPKVVKKKVTAKATERSAAQKAQRAEARKRLAAARAAMKGDIKAKQDQVSTFDAGFFKVESPVKENVPRPRERIGSSPLVRSVKKPTTPSASNFMHGRVIRCRLNSSITSSPLSCGDNNSSSATTKPPSSIDSPLTKKTKLNFTEPADENNQVEQAANAGSTCNQMIVDDGSIAQGDVKSTSTNFNNNNLVVTSPLPISESATTFSPVSSSHSGFETRTVGTETDFSDATCASTDDQLDKLQENMSQGFQTVTQQLRLLIDGANRCENSVVVEPTNPTSPRVAAPTNPQQQQQTSNEENQLLQEENARLKDQLQQALKTVESPYEEHYHRKCEEVQMMEARMSQHHQLMKRIPQIQTNISRNAALIEQRTREVNVERRRLTELQQELNRRNEIENEELLHLRNEHAQVENERNRFGALGSENQDLRKDAENAAYQISYRNKEIEELMKTCEMYQEERDQLAKHLGEQQQVNSDLVQEIDGIKNQIEFERNEQTVDLQFKDSEMERLKSIIGSQDSLKSTSEGRLTKLEARCKESEESSSALQGNVESLKVENNNLLNKLINESDALEQLKENHSRKVGELEDVTSSIVTRLNHFHQMLVTVRIEQSRRSLDFLNSTSDELLDDDDEQTIHLEKNLHMNNGVGGEESSPRGAHESALQENLSKSNEFMNRIVELNHKIRTKNESDQLKLRCDFRAMRDKLNSYEEQDCKKQSTSSKALTMKQELITQLTTERDAIQAKYQSLEQQFSEMFMKRK